MIEMIIMIAGFFIGINCFLLTIFRVPSYESSRLTKVILSNGRIKSSYFDNAVYQIATIISKHLPYGKEEKKDLEQKLKALDFDMTAEFYTSLAISKALIILVLVIPFLFIMPIIAGAILIGSISVFFVEKNKVNVLMKERREKIDKEIPSFARGFIEKFKTNQNIIKILEDYKDSLDSGLLKKELEITVTDSKVSSIEKALANFDTRVGSKNLTDFIRGLLGVLSGNIEMSYFEYLAYDMKKEQFQALKHEMEKRPSKMGKWTAFLFLCFIATWIVVFTLEVIKQATKMGSLG